MISKPIQCRFAHLVGNADHADFWFIIKEDGVRIPAHKLIISACSNVLNNIVYGSDSGYVLAVDQSEVDDISGVAFLEVLRYMYTDNPTITIENVVAILKKANYFGLDILQQKCITFLLKNINTNTCLAFFADLYALLPFENLARKCLEFIRLQPSAAFNSRLWADLDSDTVRVILSSDVINCDEYTLFVALLQWIKADRQFDSESNLKSLAADLKNCIRWTTLSIVQFNRIISLEVDFMTQAERNEIEDIIRDGSSLLNKRRTWFWNHARWVTTNLDMPLPTDAVFISFHDDYYRGATYVSRNNNGLHKYNPRAEAGMNVEVLCGSGYKWVPLANHIIPENLVTSGFKDENGADTVLAMSSNSFRFSHISVTNLIKLAFGNDENKEKKEYSEEEPSEFETFTDESDSENTDADNFENIGAKNLLVLVGTIIESVLPQTEIPPDAIRIGTHNSHPAYLGRIYFDGDILPANIIPAEERALAPYNCAEQEVNVYSFLRLTPDTFEWIESSNGRLVPEAVEGGRSAPRSELLYFGRAMVDGNMHYGKVHPSHKLLYYGESGLEKNSSHYEVLVYKQK